MENKERACKMYTHRHTHIYILTHAHTQTKTFEITKVGSHNIQYKHESNIKCPNKAIWDRDLQKKTFGFFHVEHLLLGGQHALEYCCTSRENPLDKLIFSFLWEWLSIGDSFFSNRQNFMFVSVEHIPVWNFTGPLCAVTNDESICMSALLGWYHKCPLDLKNILENPHEDKTAHLLRPCWEAYLQPLYDFWFEVLFLRPPKVQVTWLCWFSCAVPTSFGGSIPKAVAYPWDMIF